MRKEIQEIVDLMLKKFGEYRSFETEHFIYWIKYESYYYDDKKVTRDEFKYIKQYAAYNGTLPNVERKKRLLTKSQKERILNEINACYKDNSHPEVNTGTYSHEKILRYSKTFDSLEYYSYDINVRASMVNKSSRIIVMPKRRNIFTVTNKGYVRIFGNRWLSLKNMSKFNNLYVGEFGENVIRLLIKSMIRKDWVLNLELDNSIMISNESARKADSLEQAIELECGVKPAKILKKIYGDNINPILEIYSLIEPNKIHDITNFLKKNFVELNKILKRHSGGGLLFYYFLSKDNRCEFNILTDYFKMLVEQRKKVNLKISSYSTLKRNHDELSRQILLKTSGKGGRLSVAKLYPNIKSSPNIQVEKIKTVKRLNRESEILKHCVHSYKSRINRGECAIYSLFYDGNTYTLELGADKRTDTEGGKEYDFKINQLRGKYNCSPPEQMRVFLEKMCEENSLLPLSEGSVYFESKSKNNKKIVQLGSEILKRVDFYGNIHRAYEGEEPFKINLEELMLDGMPF